MEGGNLTFQCGGPAIPCIEGLPLWTCTSVVRETRSSVGERDERENGSVLMEGTAGT